jgi:hypothetical protein
MQPPPYFANLSLYFSKLPLISLSIPFELVVMILEAANQVTHLTVDGP